MKHIIYIYDTYYIYIFIYYMASSVYLVGSTTYVTVSLNKDFGV